MNEDKDQTLLCAYLDGELSAEDRRAFEERLAREPELQRTLAQLSRVDTQLREVLDRINESPVPESISRALAGAEREPPAVNSPTRRSD